jgi:hypothetical protein
MQSLMFEAPRPHSTPFRARKMPDFHSVPHFTPLRNEKPLTEPRDVTLRVEGRALSKKKPEILNQI